MTAIPRSVGFDNVSNLPTVHKSLHTRHGIASGTFVELVPGVLYLAHGKVKRNGKLVKPGTCFVIDDVASTTNKKVFTPYDSIYGVIRAFLTYAKGWAAMQVDTLDKLHRLTQICLAGQFGWDEEKAGEFGRLMRELKHIITTGDDTFTTHRKVRRAIATFVRTLTTTRPGSRQLGFSNSAGAFSVRLGEVKADHTFVVSLGMVMAEYLGSVLDVVRKERTKVDALMALSNDALLTEENAHGLTVIGHRLFTTCVVRPTTHVGERASRDCMRAAEMIRTAVASGPVGNDAATAVRNLVSNVRDSLDLLLWQYDLEQLITRVAAAVRNVTPLDETEWSALCVELTVLVRRVSPPFGSRFENTSTMPDVRARLREASDIIQNVSNAPAPPDNILALRNVKTHLVAASNCV